MVLAMSRPHRHPKTGMYWLRERVPADVIARVGRSFESYSLRTKNEAEAKRLLSVELAKLETRWEALRRAPHIASMDANSEASVRNLSEREAAERAEWMYG